jgi:hypothetical protein
MADGEADDGRGHDENQARIIKQALPRAVKEIQPDLIFTEGRQGNEATGAGLYPSPRQALLLPLLTGSQRRFEKIRGSCNRRARRSRPTFLSVYIRAICGKN